MAHRAIITGIFLIVILSSGCAANSIIANISGHISESPQDWKRTELIVANVNSKDTGLGPFLEALGATHLFRDVRYEDDPTEIGALIVKDFHEESTVHRNVASQLQLISVLTFGIIPQIEEISRTVTFTIERAGFGKPVSIAFTIHQKSVFGWASVFYRMSPNWSADSRAALYGRVLTTALAEKSSEIEARGNNAP